MNLVLQALLGSLARVEFLDAPGDGGASKTPRIRIGAEVANARAERSSVDFGRAPEPNEALGGTDQQRPRRQREPENFGSRNRTRKRHVIVMYYLRGLSSEEQALIDACWGLAGKASQSRRCARIGPIGKIERPWRGDRPLLERAKRPDVYAAELRN